MVVTTIEKLGTWADVFGHCDEAVAALAADLRSVILGLHGNTIEVPRKGDRAVSFGHGEKKMSESYCYLMPQKDYVNIGFYWGAQLADPYDLLEGSGKKLRHVKVRDLEMARSAKLASLVHTAITERRKALKAIAAEKEAAKNKIAKNKVGEKA